jgi:hypothetical protein
MGMNEVPVEALSFSDSAVRQRGSLPEKMPNPQINKTS